MTGNVKDGFSDRRSSDESSSYIRINAAVTDGLYEETGAVDYSSEEYDDSRPVTAADVAAIVRRMLSEVRVYVLESDIAKSRDDVNGVVGETYF